MSSRQYRTSSTHLRERNKDAPVNHLPVEILCNVFHEVVKDLPYEVYYRHLLPLSEVCFLWNQIINNTPQLWSTISLSWNTKFISKALTTSKQASLDVHVVNIKLKKDTVVYEGEEDIQAPQLLCNLTKENILNVLLDKTPRRWKSADFRVANGTWMARIIRTISNTASSFEQLQLRLDDFYTTNIYNAGFPIEVRSIPHLRCLFIDSGLVSFPTTGMPGLRSLRMTPSSHIEFSSDEWHKMLSGCLNLVELEVVGVLDLDSLQDAHDPTKVTKMPSLEVLILSCDSTLAAFTLESISAPACRILHVEFDDYTDADQPTERLQKVMALHAPIVAQHVADASQGSFRIICAPNRLAILPAEGDANAFLNHTCSFRDHGQVLQSLVDNASTGGPVSIVLSIGSTASHSASIASARRWCDDVLRCIIPWPAVNAVWTGMSADLVEDLLGKLATPSSPTSGLPWPSLREITIDCNLFIDAIPVDTVTNFLTGRYGQQSHLYTPVSPLREFRITRPSIWSLREREALSAVLEQTGVRFEEGVNIDSPVPIPELPEPSLSLQPPARRAF